MKRHSDIAMNLCSICCNHWRWTSGTSQRPGDVCNTCWGTLQQEKELEQALGTPAQRRELDVPKADVFSVIQEKKRNVTRKEVLEITGIDPTDWNIIIKMLLAEGKVRKEGKKRGAKYFLEKTDKASD